MQFSFLICLLWGVVFHPTLLCAAPETTQFDVVVAGGTPGGLMAAIAAARLGEKVLVLEPTRYLGGVVAGGLTASDIGRASTIGGLSREFFNNVLAHYMRTYGPDSPQVALCRQGYNFEPKVAAQVFAAMLAERPEITVWKRARLSAVRKEGNRIIAVTVNDLENNRTVQVAAPVFVDATYEGDLMALAGVAYRLGREGMKEYNEPHGLGSPARPGDAERGDRLFQAYNFRLCLTNDPPNRVPAPAPEGYDAAAYATLRAQLQEPGITKHFLPDMFNGVALPNAKIDANAGHGAAQTSDYVGANYDYPEADWTRREAIIAEHRRYVQGLLYFIQNDPAVPAALQAEANEWGLSRDEFTDNDNWPTALYIREARRMIGQTVFREQDATTDRYKEDAVGVGSYPIDMHGVERRVRADGLLAFGGGLSIHGIKPYEIPYGVLLPREVANLLVPVCCSATSIGYATLRMEPVFMILGHAAGTAAHLAKKNSVPVQQVPVPELQRLLQDAGQILRANRLPVAAFTMEPDGAVHAGEPVRFQDTSTDDQGVVAREWDFDGNGTVDSRIAAPTFTFRLNKTYRVTLRVRDADGDWSEPAIREVAVTDGLPSYPDIIVDNDAAQFVGRWPISAVLDGFYGPNYAHDGNQNKGEKLARYTIALPTPGNYDVAVSYTATVNRADNVPVIIRHRGGETK
ncbi:MAG: FAD-dependent oxidoreductase, partial [Armatimonadota bacterium]|nr:FAD-dependent oxidoreductase [Armatimonadota bacterium]